MSLGETLREELNCENVFTVGGIGISESVVVTWIIMGVVLLISLLVTRKLKVENPGKGQLLLEHAVTWIQGVSEGIVGTEGKGYAAYLTAVLIYIGAANLVGVFGFKPPTKDMNVTAALALMSIVLIEFSGIHKKESRSGSRALRSRLCWLRPSIYWSCLSNPFRCACVCSGMCLARLSL